MNYYVDNKPILAWHGTRADGTTHHLKVKEIVGIKTILEDNIVLCVSALHGSVRAIDMLKYSTGTWIKRTLHEGTIVHDADKIGSSERTVIAEANAMQLIVDWAFWCADRAIHIHAVSALRQAGMTEEAEKLASLEAITDKKSARIARDIIYIVDNTVNASSSYTAVNAAVYIVNAADTTDATTRAGTHAAAYAAYTTVHSASKAVHAAYIAVCAACVTCASGAAYAADTAARAAAVRTAVLDAVRAVLSAAAADSAAYAAYAIRSAAVHTSHAAADPVHGVCAADSTDIAEMSFLNAELERRLFILMGITKTKGLEQ